MPLCSLLLLSLADGHAGIGAVLDALGRILAAAHVHRPIIRATRLDAQTINDTPWHLLLIVVGAPAAAAGSSPHAAVLRAVGAARVTMAYTVTLGVPSALANRYAVYSDQLAARAPPPLSSSLDELPRSSRAGAGAGAGAGGRAQDTQNLEVSDELLRFADELEQNDAFARRPVVMLNLLQFQPGMHESYKNYGKGFVQIGARHGGDAKLVGLVVAPGPGAESDSRGDRTRAPETWWSEAAYAQYPSIRHFIDMAASPDYQAINQRFRLPALRDTTILCTTEIERARYASPRERL